jgi:hypothetical protein
MYCDLNWSLVHQDTFGWNDLGSVLLHDESASSFSPTNQSLCYKFEYDGPAQASDSYVWMSVVSPPSGHADCDSEGIGGFKSNSDWFDNMADHLGDPPTSIFDNMVKAVRASAEASSLTPYKTNMTLKDYSIYCAPSTSKSCNYLGGFLWCQQDCYGDSTYGYVRQGYLDDPTPGNPNDIDQTLYGNNACTPSSNIIHNRMLNASYSVYKSETIANLSDTADQTCFRTNEAPSAGQVQVIPLSPNAGQDLECTFNYTDPENFVEQNSTYEWWKNGANQNINSPILDKGNLTVGDSWFCKATPSDGLLFGTKKQSDNNVTILTTVKNPTFKIGTLTIWSKPGYYGSKEEVLGFNQYLQDELSNCIPDQNGLCDINLTFSSEATGVLELTNLEIFYSTPVIFNLTNLTSSYSNTLVEFQVVNTILSPSNFSWNINFGDGVTVSSTFETYLTTHEDLFVIAQYNYTVAGQYNITANALQNGGIIDSKTLSLTVS